MASSGTSRVGRSRPQPGDGPGPIDQVAPDDPEKSAAEAGLRYVSGDRPGITRRRSGRGFTYIGPDGKTLRDPATLDRIRSLVIPPAWERVWICPWPNGHLQATGYDARGRKQYRYHPQWRQVRDQEKYGRLIAFSKALPRIRRRVQADLKRPGMPREKVLAAVVWLLEATLIRVGNDEYARHNRSYGLTTMHGRHVQVDGSRIAFRFRGKAGKKHDIDLSDSRLARIISRCQELPGQELFEYVDEHGESHDVGSQDVNDYLRQISGQEFTAKDFRTWAGTVLAAKALQEFRAFDSQAAAKRNVVRAVERVAERLGNTKAVCRRCYIHPAILDAYMERELVDQVADRTRQVLRSDLRRLPPEEAVVLALLHERMQREKQKRAAAQHPGGPPRARPTRASGAAQGRTSARRQRASRSRAPS